MPHSSGGGFHGGGFHGGGFHGGSHGSSSGNYRPMFSTTYFPGARTYIYYRHFHPYVVYTSLSPEKSVKGTWISLIVKLVIMMVPLIIMLITGFHTPKKLNTNYDTTIVIRDSRNYLSNDEKTTLKTTFKTFYDKTGITPALFVGEDSLLGFFYPMDHVDQAYYEYTSNFKDEKHWLILYQPGNNWWFEGMQGNDTDSILYPRVTNKFNKTLYNDLEDGKRIGEAVNHSFNVITPHIMDTYYYVGEEGTAFGVIWSLVFAVIIGVDIYSLINLKRIKGGYEVAKDTKLEKANCPYCDTPYYKGVIKKCPQCGANLMEDIDFDIEESDAKVE